MIAVMKPSWVSVVLACSIALYIPLPSLCQGGSLLRAPAPSPGGNTGYASQLLSALQGNASESGPILFKTFEAAYFLEVTEAQTFSELQQVDAYHPITIGNASQLLLAWSAGNAALTLAFAASDSDNASLTQPVSTLHPAEYLNDLFGGNPPNINPAALDPFMEALDSITAPDGAINNVTGGSSINRILCAGHGGGGTWAQLCGPWAQVNYPAAQVRVITFGSPRVGDEKLDWALQQLVDLPYLWLTATDNRTIGQLPAGPLVLPNISRVIPDNASASGQPGSVQYYATLLNNTLKANGSAIPMTLQFNFSYGYLPSGRSSEFVASSGTSQSNGVLSEIRSAAGTASDTLQAAGSAISNAFHDLFSGASPAPAPGPSDVSVITGSPSPSGECGTPQSTGGGAPSPSPSASAVCTPVLCKLKPAVAASCAAYNNGNNTTAPGSRTISAGPIGTNVAVAWDGNSRVATFAWRGTEGAQDWVQNLKLRFAADSSSAYFQELYSGTRVYDGELNQFRAATDQAKNNSVNIRVQLEMMLGGVTPSRVDCVGHSLGGGLATICGPWAAEQWPGADVRVATFGSPKAGNLEFSMSVYAVVGRIYRAVNEDDEVSSLPPFTSYVHANYPIWLHNHQVILDDRPPTDIGSLTWAAHGCDDMYEAKIQEATNATVPGWVENLP